MIDFHKELSDYHGKLTYLSSGASQVVTFRSEEIVYDGCSRRLLWHTDEGIFRMLGNFPSYFTFEPGRRMKIGNPPSKFDNLFRECILLEYWIGVYLSRILS